ncbi:C4-dicarboxylate transporter DcuC [Enterocloster lavalensis]|uniref:C4-dicarboxylate transporter DcuC n=1 Tax=Enterocloster lavalensis TaxID=460384 RepID=UPI002A7EC971|nr:C4-dicarboxylate transporter DcuC [Enterocloster lavalensis]
MVWAGALIVLITFAAILKNLEARMVLILSGAAMALIAGIAGVEGCFDGAMQAFISQLINESLVPTICACMGFSAVMEYTKCSSNLVYLLTRPLQKVRFAVVPGAILITWLINIVVMSAAGCAATVGTLLVPMMLGLGVHPATAAACILIGTWGNVMNPGQSFNVQVGELASMTGLEVVSSFTMVAVIALAASIVLLTAIDITMVKKGNKQGAAYAVEPGSAVQAAASQGASVRHDSNPGSAPVKINYFKALIPATPIIFLLLGNAGVLPNFDITVWMLSCSVLGLLLDVRHVQDGVKQFFNGVGNSYRDIITLMAAASVFTFGMNAVGLTGALVDVMKNSTAIARLGAGFGPFIIAALSGSGNAAAIAFNTSITPHAADLGYAVEAMGSVAQIAAAIGRSASPVAGVTIICAKMAGVSPMDVVKRSILPMLAAVLIFMFMLM